MNFFSGIKEISETSRIKGESEQTLSSEALDKYDKILDDDKLEFTDKEIYSEPDLIDIDSKLRELFDSGDFFKDSEENSENIVSSAANENCTDATDISKPDSDINEPRENNAKYELNGNTYETDDNGKTYKMNDKLLADVDYTVNDNVYRTDEHGNIVSCDSKPSYTEEGARNIKEQKEAGGEERQKDDDGGHIIAKSLGGSEGSENLVPMRTTINRGDYKKMENEISKADQDGKNTALHVDLEYDGDSKRPSKLRAEYEIDGKKTVTEFDNEKNSVRLLDSVKEKISNVDYNTLKEEIKDMRTDGVEVSITSVKNEYDESGNPKKITVGLLDETAGTKTYKVYESQQEVY